MSLSELIAQLKAAQKMYTSDPEVTLGTRNKDDGVYFVHEIEMVEMRKNSGRDEGELLLLSEPWDGDMWP